MPVLSPRSTGSKRRTVPRRTMATERPALRLPESFVTGGRGRASAEIVKPSEDRSKASFGMTVTLRRDDGREQIFKIVGEDEADPSRGTVSYVSPLARAVLTHGPGETVVFANSEAVILDVR